MDLTRRLLREKSLQVLYAYELTKDPIEQIKLIQLEELDKKDDRKFCDTLISYTIRDNDKYEQLIKDTVDN